jgi:hypothetical protein
VVVIDLFNYDHSEWYYSEGRLSRVITAKGKRTEHVANPANKTNVAKPDSTRATPVLPFVAIAIRNPNIKQTARKKDNIGIIVPSNSLLDLSLNKGVSS